MTHRERLQKALAHEEADHIPLDLNGTGSTGICGRAYQCLRQYLGLPERPLKIWHVMQQLADVDEDFLSYLKVDTRHIVPNAPTGWNLEITERDGSWYYTDEWGIGWRMPIVSGHYYDMYSNPLRDAETIQDVERHNWPNPTDPARFAGLAEKAKQLYEQTGAAITFGPMCAGIFDMAAWLCGYEKCMMDIACNIKLVQAIMENVTDIKCKYWETTLPIIGSRVDMVMECDDLGGQYGPLFNTNIYEQYIKPLHKRLLGTIRKHTDAAIYFHSCGSIYDFLPGFIECGVQVLNPVQVSAAKMDTKVLKKEFGKDIVFWGGGCETQTILWRGTVQEVRDEVKRRIDDLAPGGGFVFAQVHNIQDGVPPENLMAMWETWSEYGKY